MSNFNSVYTRLVAFKTNLPENNFGVRDFYVSEYHSLLTELSTLVGQQLHEYQIPMHLGREIPHYQGVYFPREFVLMKLDALLMFFQLEDEGKTYGFRVG